MTHYYGSRSRHAPVSKISGLKKASLYLQILLFGAAGINHFVHPAFYLRIIPPYLPFHMAINIVSGISEFVLSLLLVFQATRKIAAYLIIVVLILFIPAHIYTLEINRCTAGKVCLPLVIAWLRLIPGQLLLIWWAFSVRSYK